MLLLSLFGTSGRPWQPYLPALPLRCPLRGAEANFVGNLTFHADNKIARLMQQTNVTSLVQPLYDRPLHHA